MSKLALNAPPPEEYNHNIFITVEASKRYTMIARKITFKEKGFEHPVNKGWRELYKPPMPVVISIVREFCANLVDQALRRVWVRGKWVPFDSEKP